MIEDVEEVDEDVEEPMMDGLATQTRKRKPPKPKGKDISGRQVSIMCVPCGGGRNWKVLSGTIATSGEVEATVQCPDCESTILYTAPDDSHVTPRD